MVLGPSIFIFSSVRPAVPFPCHGRSDVRGIEYCGFRNFTKNARGKTVDDFPLKRPAGIWSAFYSQKLTLSVPQFWSLLCGDRFEKIQTTRWPKFLHGERGPLSSQNQGGFLRPRERDATPQLLEHEHLVFLKFKIPHCTSPFCCQHQVSSWSLR